MMKRKNKFYNLFVRLLITAFVGSCLFAISSNSVSAAGSTYGSGAYGECEYGLEGSDCSISITNNNSNAFILSLFVSPTVSGACTIASDTVGVTTYDPNGYTLTLQDQATDSNLDNGANNIPITTGTQAVPIALSNTWGYRIDGYSGFGLGPTSPVTDGPASSIKFAVIKNSGQTADTIASTSTYSATAVTTQLFYGVCLTYGSVPYGQYSSTVTYTATAN
jgi:hypothetical protein